VAISDTSEKADAVYWKRLAAMSPAERVRIGVELWIAGDRTQRSAMRSQYPDADEAEISFRIAVSRFGLELARRAYRRA
jgi:hypothetical protein